MSSFTEPLHLTPMPANGTWRTTRDFSYEIGKLGSGLVIVVLEGTETDLGTVPYFAAWLVKPHDPTAAAAYVLHDMLCRDRSFSRLIADAVLLESLVVLGVPKWRATIVFAAVRLWARLKP